MSKIGVRFSTIVAFVMCAIGMVYSFLAMLSLCTPFRNVFSADDIVGFAFGTLIFGSLSFMFYFTDLVLMIVFHKINKQNLIYTIFLFIMILAGVPLLLFIGELEFVPALIWGIYFLVFNVLEVIYFIRYLRSDP